MFHIMGIWSADGVNFRCHVTLYFASADCVYCTLENCPFEVIYKIECLCAVCLRLYLQYNDKFSAPQLTVAAPGAVGIRSGKKVSHCHLHDMF